MKHKWIARPYKEGDEKGIFELRKVVYPGGDYDYERWLRRWRWFYQENPAGKSYIWLAEDSGKIVGQAATVPVLLKIGDAIVRGRLGADAMTHPEYRHQGMYPILTKHRNEETGKDGIYITYSFSGRSAVQRITKKYFGTVHIGNTRVFAMPFDWRNTLKLKTNNGFLLTLGALSGGIIKNVLYRAKKLPVIEGLTIKEIAGFDGRFDGFWSEVSGHYQIMVARSREYLKWRYVDIPDTEYSIYSAEKDNEIHGYMVLRKLHRKKVALGVIFDILALSPGVTRGLIGQAVQYFRQLGVDMVYGSMLANSKLYGAFRDNGFIPVPFVGHPFDVQNNTPGDNPPNISREWLTKPGNWYTQIGDSDLF